MPIDGEKDYSLTVQLEDGREVPYPEELSEILDIGEGASAFSPGFSEYCENVANQIELFCEGMKNFADAMSKAIKEVYIPLLDMVWDALTPAKSRRVFWLAAHHKKNRVRKKNLSRIAKAIKLAEKRGK